MSDLIRREDVIKLIQARYESPEICAEEINRIPTVDAIPVVRCGECKRAEPFNGQYICSEFGGVWGTDGFCSCGERKGGRP